MRLGLIARADNSGLGMQTWEFYRHMHPAKTMVVDISHLNGNKNYPERYGPEGTADVMRIQGFPNAPQIDAFLQDLDVVFIAEAAYNPYVYTRAKELGVKIANQYNFEFFDWFNPDMPKPDMLIAPSKWHYDRVDAWCRENNVRHVYLHCPVNRELLPHRTIKQAKTFLHAAGRAAAHDRNGTETVIEAAKHLKTPAQIVIHFQGEQGLAHQATTTTADYQELVNEATEKVKEAGGHLTMVTNEFENYQDVYAMGDVLLLPRRYGGNCLPLNEALSVGMPVIMPDISPNNQFLPSNWLIPATKKSDFHTRQELTVDVYDADPVQLAAKIDEFYLKNESQMWYENVLASDLANTISWGTMQPQYKKSLEDLCTPS